jgi:hypothetical protein
VAIYIVCINTSTAAVKCWPLSFSVSVTSSMLSESELVKKIAYKIARYVLLSTIKNDVTMTHVPLNAFRSTRAPHGTRHFGNGILWMPGTEITYTFTCRLFFGLTL